MARKPSGEGAEDAYSIRSVHRVCDILDLLKDSRTAALPEIARAVNLPKTSAFRYLATLESRHYVQRDAGGGSYRLGSAFLDVPVQRLEVMAKALRPYMEELCEQSGETINLGVLDGHQVLYLDIVEPARGVRLAAKRGDREPLHSSSLGKALATQLTDQQILAILRATGMPARTPATITDPDSYLEDVARSRQRGYALDDRENEPDGRCIGVPIAGAPAPTALSLSAPAERFPTSKTKATSAQVIATAARMEELLAAESPPATATD